MRGNQQSNSRESRGGKGVDRELDLLGRQIEKLRVDGLRFLAGDLHVPPEELKESIAAHLRRLRLARNRSVAESFRLSSLEARFNSEVDLLARRLRKREQGEARSAAGKQPPPDPERGVVVGQSGDSNAVEVLYKGLFLKSGQRNPSMDLEKFRSYIHRQAETIRSKTGCSEIQFRIAAEGGKMKIKARPLKG